MFYKNPKRLPYYERLEGIRCILSRELTRTQKEILRMFPNGCCNDSARVVRLKAGLLEVAGYYTFPEISKGEKERLGIKDEEHAWNYDPERELWVCLTLAQFGYFPDIVVMQPNPILRISKALTYKQRGLVLEDAVRIASQI